MLEVLSLLPSAELLNRVRDLVQRGNALEADLLVHLGDIDARRLYLDQGCPSMFVWCQRVLQFAEGVTYKRIQAARAARQFPAVLEAVRNGDLHLKAVGLLAPKLTPDNFADLISAARHRSSDQIKRMLADHEPKPAAPAFVRRLSAHRRGSNRPLFRRASHNRPVRLCRPRRRPDRSLSEPIAIECSSQPRSRPMRRSKSSAH